MSAPSGWRGWLARLVLGPWLSRDERDEILIDLATLEQGIARRRGRVAARAWFVLELLRYPLHLARGGSGGTHGTHPPRASGLDPWVRELRLGVRRAVRRPGPSMVVVVTLALGIGGSASVFSVLNTLMLRPLPFREAGRLVRVRDAQEIHTGEAREVSMSPRRFELLRERATVFQEVAAARFRTFTLGGEGEPERVVGLTATWTHFTTLGVPAALGRTYGADEDAAGAPAPVAVISHSLWVRRFAGRTDAVGGELMVNGRPHTVLGVMPPGFRYPYAGEIWIPMGLSSADADYDQGSLNVTARLVPGATEESARAEMASLSASLAREGADTDRTLSYTFKSLREEILEGVPRKVVALLGAAVFVLLIGAANVASMTLARLEGEARELTVQLALGARRADLVRRFVAEGAVLAGTGLVVGLLIAGSSVDVLARLSPVSDLGPYFRDFGMDGRVVLFGTTLAVAALALASLPTLLRIRRGRHADHLRSRASSARRRMLGLSFLDLLVAGELAIAVVLLAGAGLTVRSVWAEWGSDTGIDPTGLYTYSVAPGPSGYETDEDRVAFLEAVLARVQALPGVTAAGLTNLNPLRSQGWGTAVLPEGVDSADPGATRTVNHRSVSPGYFEAAGTRIVAGRGFRPDDRPGSIEVAVVNEGLARALWPGEDPVGRRLTRPGDSTTVFTVVGVAQNVRESDFLQDTWYRPLAQEPRDYNTRVVEIFVRGEGDGSALVLGVREAVRDVDPRVPVFRVEPMEDVLAFERRVESFGTLLLALFAALGLVIAAVGIYGVLSYVTGRRTREIGVRVALGASRGQVVWSVAARTLATCVVGLAVGLGGAALLIRATGGFVVELATVSTSVYAGAGAAALLVAAAAAAAPTFRALSVHPRTALED